MSKQDEYIEENIEQEGQHNHDHEADDHGTCGCGHDHSHEDHEDHDHESCGCGHDHNHEDHEDHDHEDHDHEDHDHENHHHETCGCGHDHNHEEHDHEEHAHEDHHHEHDHELHEGHGLNTQGVEQKVYILEGLGCANCAAKMERKICQLPEVQDATITFSTKQLRVAANDQERLLPKFQEICASIESEVKVIPRQDVESKGAAKVAAAKEAGLSDNAKEGLLILAGAVFFVVGLVLKNNMPLWSDISYLITYVLLGAEIVWTAIKNIFKGNVFDENFLMSVATIGALILGDFAEAVGVMLFYRVGELFEDIAVERSRSQIMEAVDLRPEVVQREKDNAIQTIPAEDAQVGDILVVRPGDRIPLDGTVVAGESRLDTSAVTGEPVPVAVAPGAEVLSGCVNTAGVLKICVEKPLQESMVTKILNSVENAAARKPSMERFITRFSRIYTPFVVFLALATAIIPSLVTGDWSKWIYTALTFLVISCPCALVLSVPLAFFSGIGAGSKRGILFKGGLALEGLKKIQAVAMDKTGTITKGNFMVQSIDAREPYTEAELLAMAAACEKNSTHPIGQSIIQAAKEKELTVLVTEQMEELSGKGICAKISGKEVLCGNKTLLEDAKVDLSQMTKGYGTQVLLAVDGVYVGTIFIADTVKSEAKAAIANMNGQGLTTVMLTGDAQESAQEVADQVAIQEVHAKLLPQDKLETLEKIRKAHGPVMFVGDGINDAPVLAGADVGAAMGSGADAAIEAADVVFMNSSVSAIPMSIKIAKAAGSIAIQNVVVALLIKVIVMVLGLLGYANMWMAVFADTGVAMLCVLNSIRVLYRNYEK